MKTERDWAEHRLGHEDLPGGAPLSSSMKFLKAAWEEGPLHPHLLPSAPEAEQKRVLLEVYMDSKEHSTDFSLRLKVSLDTLTRGGKTFLKC